MKLFSSLFGNASSSSPTAPNPTSPEVQTPPLAHYLAQAIRGSRALTPRGESVVADYLAQFAQVPGLTKLDPGQARAREEADLALNIRAAELLRTPLSPRRPLSVFADELHRSALLHKARFDAVAGMRAFCSEMVLTLANTGDECAWCRENEGRRFSVQDDPNALLAQHCSCAPYSSTTFHPAVKAFDA